MIWFGRVSWHMNYCRLLNAQILFIHIYIYIYDIYYLVWKGFVAYELL